MKRFLAIGLSIAFCAALLAWPQKARCAMSGATAKPALSHCCCDSSPSHGSGCAASCGSSVSEHILGVSASPSSQLVFAHTPSSAVQLLSLQILPVVPDRVSASEYSPPRRYLLACTFRL